MKTCWPRSETKEIVGSGVSGALTNDSVGGLAELYLGNILYALELAATIQRTFTDLYESIYGKTDLVVSGSESTGSLPPSWRLDASDQVSKQFPKPACWVAVG